MSVGKNKRRPTEILKPAVAASTEISAAKAQHLRAFKAFCWGVAILVCAGLVVALTAPKKMEKPAPEAPLHFFNDYAQLVSPNFATGKDFWVQISPRAQFVTVIYPRSPDESIDDFTSRAANAWNIGQSGANNGLILFVFRDEKTLRLEVAYGLEATITDLDSRRILAKSIAPFFVHGDYEGGLDSGIEEILNMLKNADDAPVGGRASLPRYMMAGMRNLPRLARVGCTRFLSEGTGGRIGMCIFGAVFASIFVAGAVPLIESLPSFLLLPWRLWKSPTLRNLDGAELRRQFAFREFVRRPPLVFTNLASDVEGGAMLLGVFGALRILTFMLLLLTGVSMMVGGKGHFGGAGATVTWAAH